MAVCLCSGAALAQGGRFDGIAQSTVVVGGATVVVPLPGATITVCNHPATGQTSTTPCTNKATTYTDATLGSSCSTSTQVVLAGTSSCVAAADPQGNYGFWVPAGGYDYSICASGVCSTPNYAYVGLQPTNNTNNSWTGSNTFSGPLTGSGDNPLVWGGSVTGKNFEFYPSSQTVPFAGLLAGNTAAVTGIFIGDSITAGTGPPNNANSWSMQVSSRLQQFYGNAGNGFCDGGGGGPDGCFPVLAGAWTGAQTGPFQTVSPAFNDVQRGTSSATATVANIVSQASIDVFYYLFTDSAGFDIKLDGVSQGTFGASTAGSFTIQKATISGIPSDGSSHTLLVTAPSSGAMYLLGFMQHTGLNGCQMWNTAQPGAVSGAFASANQLNWLSLVPNPAFALVALGQNDYFATGATPATLVANHQTIYTQLKALNIPEVLLITEPPQASDSCVATPCPVDFVKAEMAWAQSLNIPIINIFARWGSYAAGNADGFYADSVHPSQTGANDITYAVLARVFPAINTNLFHGVYYPMLTGQDSIGFHFGKVNAAVTPFLVDGLNNPGIKVSQTAGNHTAGSSLWTFSNDGFASFGTTGLGTDFSDGTGHALLRSGSWWIGTGGSHNVPCALLEVGSSCQYAVDSSGNVKLNNGALLISPTAPTISTHFNTSGDSIAANGTASFVITVGTGTAGSTGALTLPTATTGWNCWLTNQNRADLIQQTASSTTSATFTNFGTTFAATNWTNSDVLRGGCKGY